MSRPAPMREALPPVDLVVVRLRERGCKPKKRGREWDASCPAHDDERPSFGVREGDDGRALVNCQRGCTHEQICDSLALQPADLFPRKPRPNIVETYEYHDANGDVLFQVVRFSPKGFRQRRPDGDGGWKWNLRGVLRVLYGLPHVEATARDGGTIYITEGEKDADAAVLAGVCATTNPGGAGKWKSAYAESLRGASSVVVVADRDEAGRQHARQVAASVSEYVEDVTIVEPLVGN
ncbi:MAG TPA: hypothetical protein VE487_07140, partial [Ilumatobacter sp.]|nr:hypothetical protein [Ilumatobacter sp.]